MSRTSFIRYQHGLRYISSQTTCCCRRKSLSSGLSILWCKRQRLNSSTCRNRLRSRLNPSPRCKSSAPLHSPNCHPAIRFCRPGRQLPCHVCVDAQKWHLSRSGGDCRGNSGSSAAAPSPESFACIRGTLRRFPDRLPCHPGTPAPRHPEWFRSALIFLDRRGSGGWGGGDYYEVVLRQTFSTPYSAKASELFERVPRASPSP